MIEWPTYVSVRADGYAIRHQPVVRRTEWDDGAVRQEQVRTASMVMRVVTVLIDTDADLARWRTWAAEHAATWFGWTDPDDGIKRRARVAGGVGGIQYTAVVRGPARRWEARLVIEGLPMDTL